MRHNISTLGCISIQSGVQQYTSTLIPLIDISFQHESLSANLVHVQTNRLTSQSLTYSSNLCEPVLCTQRETFVTIEEIMTSTSQLRESLKIDVH